MSICPVTILMGGIFSRDRVTLDLYLKNNKDKLIKLENGNN